MPANKNAYTRYLIIDSCLTNKKKYPTIKDLEKKINEKLGIQISESSITKDFKAMKDLWDAPIKYNRDGRGYEYIDKNFSIKHYPLTNDEIEALNYLSLFLNKFKGSDLQTDLLSGIDKVINDFRVNNIVKQSKQKILQTQESINNKGNEWILTLLNSITNQQCLEISYKSYQRDETKHVFSPYMLKENDRRWYVIGYNHKKNKVLSLGIDRIIKIEVSLTNYYRVLNFSEEDYFNYCMGIMKDENAEPEKIRLKFNSFQKPYVLGQPLHKSQITVEETGEHLIIELEVYITHEIIKTILAFGNEVIVLQPESLKSRIVEILKENLSNYIHF